MCDAGTLSRAWPRGWPCRLCRDAAAQPTERRVWGNPTFALACLIGMLAITTACAQTPAFKVLIFSATAGFRHASITNGILTIQMLAASNHFAVDATEDPTRFTDTNLAQYQALIFLN